MSVRYKDLRDFLDQLEKRGELRRIDVPVDTHLVMTEISDRVLQRQGPALRFDNARHNGQPARMPVLSNLFGTPQRVAQAMGVDDITQLRDIGRLLAELKEPSAPEGLRDALGKV